MLHIERSDTIINSIIQRTGIRLYINATTHTFIDTIESTMNDKKIAPLSIDCVCKDTTFSQ